MLWSASVLNDVLVSLTALLLILYLNRLLGVAPSLLAGFLRWKELVNLEDSVRLTRDRNVLAGIALLALSLLMSRYGLLRYAFMDSLSPGLQTLVVLGVLLAFLLLRAILVYALAPRRGGRETYMLAQRVLYDFIILAAIVMALTAGLLSVFGVNTMSVNRVLLYEGGVLYALFLIRRTQILLNSCNQFTAFLYLCSLELIPASLLIASSFVF